MPSMPRVATCSFCGQQNNLPALTIFQKARCGKCHATFPPAPVVVAPVPDLEDDIVALDEDDDIDDGSDLDDDDEDGQ